MNWLGEQKVFGWQAFEPAAGQAYLSRQIHTDRIVQAQDYRNKIIAVLQQHGVLQQSRLHVTNSGVGIRLLAPDSHAMIPERYYHIASEINKIIV
jgi:hypothetical protein